MQPLISVIVPVYNVENYVEACVRSLLAQSWQNLEVLLIDDGSSDRSGEICDNLSRQDARVRVFHKPNGGVAEARNLGLEKMQGDFFCFCDSDDTVKPMYLSVLYETLEKENADIAECAYVFAWENGETKRTKNFEFPEEYVTGHSGRDAVCEMMYARIHSPFCMCKLFRKEVKVHFPKLKIGEDLLAMCDAFLHVKRVAFCNQPLYLYLQRQGSAVHSEDPEKIFETVHSAERLMEMIDPADRELHQAASYFLVDKCLKALMRLYPMKQTDKVKRIAAILKAYRAEVQANPRAPKIIKMNCMLSRFGIGSLYLVKKLRSKF